MRFNKPSTAGTLTDISPEAIARHMAELRAAFDHLPLGDVIRHMTGEDLGLFHEQLDHSAVDDPFWAPVNFRKFLPGWTVPTLLVDGWHDYPLPGVCDDYRTLRDAGIPVRLRIGAGGHIGGGGEGGMTDAPAPPLTHEQVTAAITEALDNMHIGFALSVPSGGGARLIYANRGAAEILGYTVTELLERDALLNVAPESRRHGLRPGAIRLEHLAHAWTARDGRRHLACSIRRIDPIGLRSAVLS